MKDKLKSININLNVIFLLIAATIIYCFLSFAKKPPLSQQEIINIVASKSFLSTNFNSSNFQTFLKENAISTQTIPAIWNFLTVNLLPHILVVHKFPGLMLFLLTIFIYYKFFICTFVDQKEKSPILPLIFLLITSPWLVQSAIYKPNNLLALLFFTITSSYLYQVLTRDNISKNKYFLISNMLLAFTGISGLLSSVILLIVFVLVKLSANSLQKINLKLLGLSVVVLAVLLVSNKNQYLITFKKGSLLTKINPTELAHNIDERQMIDYLASNKKFLLPKVVRKFTYNKLSYGLDITIRKAISLFDFEQFASPNQSYDIIKLSGILPKGNIPLLYIWEIPLLIFGIFLVYKDHKDKRFWFTTVLLSSLVPALIFEKKDFSEYEVFLHLPFFIAEIIAITVISKSLSGKKILKKLSLTLLGLVLLISSLDFIHFLFFQNYYYLPTNLIAYQKISTFLRENYEINENHVITNRFGPTQYAIPAYLDFDFKNYWNIYNPENMTYKNFTFEQIDFSEVEPDKEKYYFGFPAEIIGEQDSYDEKMLPSYYELIRTLELEDQLVYKFGKDIWIVKPK